MSFGALKARVRPVCEARGVTLLYVLGRREAPGPLSDLDLAALLAEPVAGDAVLELLDALVVATGY